LNALGLGLLVVSGSAMALPIINAQSPSVYSNANVKVIQSNPVGFVESENLALPDNFDYIEELNKEFVKEPISVSSTSLNKDAITNALEKEDYEYWLKTLKKLEGYPKGTEDMSKEDFAILVNLHKFDNNREG